MKQEATYRKNDDNVASRKSSISMNSNYFINNTNNELKELNSSSDFQIQYARPLLIGPFVIAILAIIIIFTAQIILKLYKGKCQFYLDIFISAGIGLCYFFLILYSWVFLGDDIRLKIPYTFINYHILAPFTSLSWVISFYGLLATISTLVNIAGTYLLYLGHKCSVSTPLLYYYSLVFIAIYWLSFFIVAINLISIGCASSSKISVTTSAPSAPIYTEAQDHTGKNEHKGLFERMKRSA